MLLSSIVYGGFPPFIIYITCPSEPLKQEVLSVKVVIVNPSGSIISNETEA